MYILTRKLTAEQVVSIANQLGLSLVINQDQSVEVKGSFEINDFGNRHEKQVAYVKRILTVYMGMQRHEGLQTIPTYTFENNVFSFDHKINKARLSELQEFLTMVHFTSKAMVKRACKNCNGTLLFNGDHKCSSCHNGYVLKTLKA